MQTVEQPSDLFARRPSVPFQGTIPSAVSRVEPLFTERHLVHLNKVFANLGIEDLLRWCAVTLPNLAQLTSFGPTGMVILHYLHKLNINVPTIYLDTLHHFDESIQHAKLAADAYKIDLRVYHCLFAGNEQEFVEVFNTPKMWESDVHRYDHLVKIEPLERALSELKVEAWITGRRNSQGDARSNIQLFELDAADGRLKINPLAHWTYDQVWETIRKENIIYNPLHDLGFKSVGDKYTTVAVSSDADERAGRFIQHQGKTECGIHNRPNAPPRSRRARERWLRMQSESSPALIESLAATSNQ